MDRDNRWDRVEQAYNLMTLAQGEFQADSAVAGLQAAYARDENDEFVKATVIRAAGQADAAMEDGDALIFMNFALTAPVRSPAPSSTLISTALRVRKTVKLDFVMLTEYAADIKVACAYRRLLWKTPSANGWPKTINAAAYLRNGKIRARHLLL
nr:phosphoglyceromutase [Raoultella sp. NCTC 9187]